MLYKVTYKRRSDRNPDNWITLSKTVFCLRQLHSLLRRMERNRKTHKLISVVPE